MASPSFKNEDKDAWLLNIELKREEPEEIDKEEGIKKATEFKLRWWKKKTSLNPYLAVVLQDPQTIEMREGMAAHPRC